MGRLKRRETKTLEMTQCFSHGRGDRAKRSAIRAAQESCDEKRSRDCRRVAKAALELKHRRSASVTQKISVSEDFLKRSVCCLGGRRKIKPGSAGLFNDSPPGGVFVKPHEQGGVNG